ncbi:hypothetical protein GUITHDRAFT_136900 [Guillardia theta CCMP2712]|uniref:Uncharacterized protein n=1 Tax=Guillardia theta (strain CCMP2712) TaxID=905079 RepID=L1JJY0_GUITC|nr:hypothetical protein GUITHDRAFT_136900 [Guillardia theta CCMP2712]EKX48400.1 hypothetical protein GUITHDRAFT_136900 [Guillardia theta CCMP2712]|eukprot:XP_005835380.1 hypothetical protein GUITHDRAFT_136900 [Guillardia theta CCMP2712]
MHDATWHKLPELPLRHLSQGERSLQTERGRGSTLAALDFPPIRGSQTDRAATRKQRGEGVSKPDLEEHVLSLHHRAVGVTGAAGGGALMRMQVSLNERGLKHDAESLYARILKLDMRAPMRILVLNNLALLHESRGNLREQAMTLSVDPKDLYCRRCCKRMSAPAEDAGVAQADWRLVKLCRDCRECWKVPGLLKSTQTARNYSKLFKQTQLGQYDEASGGEAEKLLFLALASLKKIAREDSCKSQQLLQAEACMILSQYGDLLLDAVERELKDKSTSSPALLDKLEVAVQYLTASLKLNEHQAQSRFLLGKCYFVAASLLSAKGVGGGELGSLLGDAKLNRLESLKNLKTLLTVEPRHVPSLLEFGRLLQTCGQSLKRLRPFRRREAWQELFFLEAQALFKRAISMQPDSPVALLEYCISCTQSKTSEDEVRRIVQRVTERKPTDAAILCNLGCLLQKLGENKKAEEALLQAIARAPNHLPSIYNLARLHHYFLSNRQLALRFYDKVLSLEEEEGDEASANIMKMTRDQKRFIRVTQNLKFINQRS